MLGLLLGAASLGTTAPAAAQSLFLGRHAVQVAAGAYHTCVINGCGTVQCWGENHYGETTPPSMHFDQITAGLWHTCGIRSDDGLVECWGLPALTHPPTTRFEAIEAGYLHTCGLRSDGGVECWGMDINGSVSNAPGPRPYSVTRDMSAGGNLTCTVYDTKPAVECVGGGALGSPPPPFQSPTLRPGYGVPDRISTGHGFSCIILGGLVQCFGDNSQGQSSGRGGDPRFPSADIGAALTDSYGIFNYHFIDISAGIDHVCGIDETGPGVGRLVCWGRGHQGTHKTVLPAGDFVQVSAGNKHDCAIDDSGQVACWSWAENASQLTAVPTIGCRVDRLVPKYSGPTLPR